MASVQLRWVGALTWIKERGAIRHDDVSASGRATSIKTAKRKSRRRMTDDPYREGHTVNRVGAKRDFPRNVFAIGLLVSLMSTQGPGASAAGEAEAGWQLARRWCAGCHVVDMAGYGTDSAPAFATVARDRTDRRWVRAWLEAPHPPMPNMNLSRGEIDDVIAYLDTLAKH